MMYSKNYLEESGIDLEQLTSNLELIADQLFFIARAPQDRPMPVRTPKTKYRIVAQQKRACSFAGGKA